MAALSALASDGVYGLNEADGSAGSVMTARPLSAVPHQCTRKATYGIKRAARRRRRIEERTGIKNARYRFAPTVITGI